MDSNEKQTVSVLELDPGGSGRTNYGVGFGQQVLLCAENGAPLPEVPLLGQFDPRFDNHGWRNDLTKLADSETGYPLLFQMSLPEGKRDTIDWWGEVVQLHLDGTVSVQLANSEQRRVGIKNVHLLNDPHADPMYDNPMEGEEGMSEDGDELMLVDEVDEAMGSEASWETLSRRGSGVITTDSEAMPEEELYIRPIPLEAEGDDLGQVPQPDVIEAGPSTPPSGQFQTQPSLQDDEEWQHFQMLEEAPQDHHFIREPRLEASSKAYRSRLQKERRALMSSLPGKSLHKSGAPS